MNTYKRYMALAATAIICTASLPLSAMKRKDSPVQPSNEIEEKKYKTAPRIEKKKRKTMPKSEKLSGFLGEKFYEAMELIKKISIILNTAYEQEKNTPIDELPENSLRQIIKKNAITEDIFLQQLKTYFCPEAIQFFINWCETTKGSEKNDKLFENVINYTLEHENNGNFSIYNEIKTILDKEKIQYPTIEEFNKTCTEQDPNKRYKAWKGYKKKTAFHSDTITISDFPIFKKCIDETAQEMDVEIKSITINNCTFTSVNAELKYLDFNINELLYNHYTDNEIKATLQHEYTHLKNNDDEKITKIITSFLESASKENLLLLINDENSIKLIQQNTTFISQFHEKIQELFADKGIYDKNNIIYFITSLAKDFILYATTSKKSDPSPFFIKSILESDRHLPLKKRMVFWTKKDVCSWNTFNNTNQNKNTKFSITAVLQEGQEYSNFAINSLLIMDFIKTFKENNSINISKYLLKEINENERLKILKGAFTYALDCNHLDIIQKFLKPETVKTLEKTNKDFLDQVVGWAINAINSAFINAVENGNTKVIRKFLKPKNTTILAKISKKNLAWALEDATENSRVNVVQEFSDNTTIIGKLTKEVLQKALEDAKLNKRSKEWFCIIQ